MQPLNRTTITMLPLRGLVALAARCARRAQPVFGEWNDANGSDRHATAVESAIRYAEAFARGTRAPHELCGEGDPLETAADAAAQAASDTNAFEAGNAAEIGAIAARAAANAADSAQGMGPHERTRFAQATAVVAFDAVQRMIWSFPAQQDRIAARDAAVADFNALLQMNLGQYPQVGDPARLA